MEQMTLHLDKKNACISEAFCRVKDRILSWGDQVKRILVTSTVTKEEMADSAMMLSRSLAESEKKVLLVYMVPGKVTFPEKKGTAKECTKILYGLSHLLTGDKQIAEVIYSTEVTGLYIVPPGSYLADLSEISFHPHFEELMEFGHLFFDYVILNSSSAAAKEDIAAKMCDLVVKIE